MHHSNARQRGIVLVVALLMLLILTLIGVAASRGSWLQLKMAGNAQDSHVAFEAAEAELIDCEVVLTQTILPAFSKNGAHGYYDIEGNETQPAWERTTWTDGDSREYGGLAIPGVAAPPRCIVEQLPPVPTPGGDLSSDTPAFTLMYRVTARGVGASDNTSVLLQTTYRR
jgi:type IV pilus assembly protein PilX